MNPEVDTLPLKYGLVSPEAFQAVKDADWVFGCFDEDGPRFILNELCSAYGKPYVDIASDVPSPGEYGGHVCVSWDGGSCLYCLGLLDPKDIKRYLSSQAERVQIAAIYGIPLEVLGETGPSVSPINGVVAALAATEFMVAVTGMREPKRYLNYVGHLAQLRYQNPSPDCYYCKGILGQGAAADVERFLRMPHLRQPRGLILV